MYLIARETDSTSVWLGAYYTVILWHIQHILITLYHLVLSHNHPLHMSSSSPTCCTVSVLVWCCVAISYRDRMALLTGSLCYTKVYRIPYDPGWPMRECIPDLLLLVSKRPCPISDSHFVWYHSEDVERSKTWGKWWLVSYNAAATLPHELPLQYIKSLC